MTSTTSWPPPAPPTPPQHAPAAQWLSLVGAMLVAAAALVVGVAGRDVLGAYGPAAGLVVAAGITFLAGRRLTATTPAVARVVDHLARVEAAIAVTALAGALLPWPYVVATFGLAVAALVPHWRFGGLLGRSGLLGMAGASLLVTLSAETPLPLGVALGIAALGVAALETTARRQAIVTNVAWLLALAANLAPLGGWPGARRVGPGTLARLGLRGDVLAWAAPVASTLAAVAVIVLVASARRPIARTTAHATVAVVLGGLVANTLIGLGAAEWPTQVSAIWWAVLFVGIEAAAVALRPNRVWRGAVDPVAMVASVAALTIGGLDSIARIATVAVDADPSALAAVVPALLVVGVALTPTWNRTLRAAAGLAFAGAAVFVATGSATAVAAVTAIALLASLAVPRSTAVSPTALAAVAAALAAIAQVRDGVAADVVAVAVLAAIGWAIGRRADAGSVALVVAGAWLAGQFSELGGATGDVVLVSVVSTGLAGLALVAGRRSTVLAGVAAPWAFGLLAFGQAASAFSDAAEVTSAAGTAALAAYVAVSIGLVGRVFAGRGWASVIAISAPVGVLAVLVALGQPWDVVVGLGLAGGIALAGIAFARTVYGAGDTAALATLAATWLAGVSRPDGDVAVVVGWAALTAFGIALALHGCSRLDRVLAWVGTGLAAISAVQTLAVLDAGPWLMQRLDEIGVSPADITVGVISAALSSTAWFVHRRSRGREPWQLTVSGPALLSGYLIATLAAAADTEARMLVILTLAVIELAVGARVRSTPLLIVGAATAVGSVLVVSWTTLVALPTWAWMAAAGLVLLAIATMVERRDRTASR